MEKGGRFTLVVTLSMVWTGLIVNAVNYRRRYDVLIDPNKVVLYIQQIYLRVSWQQEAIAAIFLFFFDKLCKHTPNQNKKD